MKKIKEIAKTALLMLFAVAGFYACAESDKITIGSDDGVPPGAPVLTGTLPLNGGVRLYYQIPPDKDLLSIDAEYTVADGEVRRFSASYFVDSLDVLGMTGEQTVRLYAVDRAGNKSTAVSENVSPLESPISQVLESIKVIPGFSSLIVNWKNTQQQRVNVYVKLNYTLQGVGRETDIVFTSTYATEQQFINLTDITTVDVSVFVGDKYGNASATKDYKQLALQQDVVVPKKDWKLPAGNDTIGGVPMVYDAAGRIYLLMDDIIDYGMSNNTLYTGGLGRTGQPTAPGEPGPDTPWNLIIDLGDYYELSRIVTYQTHFGDAALPEFSRGIYYGNQNVGTYNMYVWTGAGDPRDQPWNEAGWEFIRQHTIPRPIGLNDAEISRKGHAGDEAVLYPDDPHYTPPTRWFRYEALFDFFGTTAANRLSEITLYGKKK